MAHTPRRQLNNYRYYDCANCGTYKEIRGANGYTYEALQVGQPTLVLNFIRADENSYAFPHCATCGLKIKSRSIVDYATGREETRHECGPKCMAATGPNCECRCKGANHGA